MSAIIGGLNILGFFGLKMDRIRDYINTLPASDIIQYILLVIGMCFFARAWVISRSNSLSDSELVLRDIAEFKTESKYSKWGFGEHVDCGLVQINNTWQEWLVSLLKTTGRQDLDTHNFGENYHLYDLNTGETTSFPKDKAARESVIGNSLPVGRIFRVMPNNK